MLKKFVATSVTAVPVGWLLSLWLDADTAWSVKLVLSGLISLAVLSLLRFASRLVSGLRANAKAKRDQLERKARLWNKLYGMGTPLENSKTLCLEDYWALRDRMAEGSLAPVDVLEAFQARTLMIDNKASRVKEVVYDADVRALMLEDGRAAEALMPAATFYYNPALAHSKARDEETGDMSETEHPVLTALRTEGAIDIAQVDKAIEQVTSLLLNHGAHFFAGQYPTRQLGEVLRAIASKPVCAAVLSRDQAPGRFLVILAPQPRLPSLAAAAVTPGMRDHMMALTTARLASSDSAAAYRVGFVFMHQRRSQADGRRPPGEDSVAELLSSATSPKVTIVRQLPGVDRLLAASDKGDAAEVRGAAKTLLADHSLDGLAVVAGVNSRLAQQLAGFMDLSVYHLVDHLAELYLCHPHDKLRAGLAIAQEFGRAIRL